MSTSAANVFGVDDDFEWIAEQIRELKHLGEKTEVTQDQSYDLSVRWGTALAGRLRRLVLYSSQGRLEGADEQRFQVLCTELRGLSELIDRFGLTQPVFTVPAPAKAKRHRGPRRTNSRRAPGRRRGPENPSPAA
ncbi:hypothetical protein EHH44_20225 [Mycolicibacter terrae]|uniref:Uncharacterized protein n=2 Tax=Mycolicibacter TaxID=1073531 RepID=A0A1A2XW65_MYCSD|nr:MULTISPECIES: hypothetical protein [Mycolicibacter]OBH15435.1 hypothetical protein A5694_09175 [Mycolicibacter sinensis]OBI30010.1 hypothetical protein A5710_02350 [Mycolicibacter sinensis]RRR40495.1 hypothetical protein EHH44_20225 [Mycolicibacter terrae]